MKRKGFGLLLFLAIGLIAALVIGELFDAPQEDAAAANAYLDALLDRAGVTQWAELADWLEMQGEDLPVTGETTVWAARNGHTYFHSVPVCGGMKSPVAHTLHEVAAEGLKPCPVCWDMP